MKIDEIIMNAAYAAEARTGTKPTLLYLGSRQHAELKQYLKEQDMRFAPQQVAGFGPRETFNGMKVYRVDDSDHILVA